MPQLAAYLQRAKSAARHLRHPGQLPRKVRTRLRMAVARRMSRETILARLQRELTSENLGSEAMQILLRRLEIADREALSLRTRTMVQYYGVEAEELPRAEEEAVLRAAPAGYALEELNGLNVGCGNRPVHPSLLHVDAHKGAWRMGSGSEQSYTSIAHLRAWAHELPFRPASIDFIVAVHVLEHVADPVRTVLHWLDLLRPGGGIGVVVPDWRYTWDARNDHHPWGHRWNCTPEVVGELYEAHWKETAELQALQSYRYKLSFDFVLRKHGVFEPFDVESAGGIPTGKQLFESGRFLESAAA